MNITFILHGMRYDVLKKKVDSIFWQMVGTINAVHAAQSIFALRSKVWFSLCLHSGLCVLVGISRDDNLESAKKLYATTVVLGVADYFLCVHFLCSFLLYE